MADVSVRPAELSAGVNKVASLFGDCETATVAVGDVLGGMAGAAGHPGLVSAIGAFTESTTKALVNTGQILTYIAKGLSQNASEYSKTEAANAKNITSAGSGKSK